MGVAVVVNSWKPGGSAFPLHIASRIFDHYLGSPPRDYLVDYRQSWERTRKSDADELKTLEQSRLKKSPPSLPLDRYAGLYKDKLGLDITVTGDAKGLALQYANSERAPLAHWHDDTFQVLWKREFAEHERKTFVTFRVNEEGKSTALHFEVFRDAIDAERVETPGK